jgi:hypothetical protein
MHTNPQLFSLSLLFGFGSFSLLAADTAQSVTAKMSDDHIAVMVADKLFTTYRFNPEQKYPFFYPLIGPASGETLTTYNQRPFPHHSSLFISLDNVQSEGVARGNYWQPRDNLATGHILSRNPEILSQDGQTVVLRDHTDWIVPDADSHQLSDIRTVTISAPTTTIRLLDFEIELRAAKDIVLRSTGHSFLSVRMRPELAVGCQKLGADWAAIGTGVFIDSLGNRNEQDTREKTSHWCAAYGTLNGVTEGVAIIQHPQSAMYPAKWFNRDYGFMSPTPFAFGGTATLKKGETLTFRYRVVVFHGDHEQADLAGWHQHFESTPPSTLTPQNVAR